MFLFVIAIIFFVAAIVLFPIGKWAVRSSKDLDNYDARNRRQAGVTCYVAAIVLAVGALVAFFVDCAATVSTKNVGIETEFGRPAGVLSNGFHLVAPWAKITEMDAAIQTDSYLYNQEAAKSTCITVRIAHQTTACVNVSIRWRINEKAAAELFQNYRTFDNVRDSLVTRELNAVMNAVFETYDPLAIDANGISTAPSLATLSNQVTVQMQSDIGDQVTLLNPGVIIQVVNFTPSTQDRINALQQQIAQTRIAAQQIATNQSLAKANQALAQSVSNDPNVLVSRCLDYLNELANKNLVPPAGFSCWPSSGSSVVLPAASK